MTLQEHLMETAEWEYNLLVTEFENQGEDWTYPGGFEAWFEEVFMKEEGWAEIRTNTKQSWEDRQ